MSDMAAERQPLLRDEEAPLVSPQTLNDAHNSSTPTPLLSVIIPGLLILFLGEWANALIGVSMGALMERSICERRFPDVVDSLTDPRCKTDAVQAELSVVRGWETTFLLMPGILTAVPYSMLAEARGPKVVVLLMFAGMMITHATELLVCINSQLFDTRWVWFCAMFVVIGGGPAVFTSMMHYIASNISTAETRATNFLYCTAVTTLGSLTAGPVGYLLMKNGPVFTKCTVLVIGATMFCLQLSIPADSIKRKRVSSASETAGSDTPTETRPLRRVYSAWKKGRQGLRNLSFSDFKIFLLLSTLSLYTIAVFSKRFRLQYATKRFGWTWEQAGFIPSIAAAINLAVVGIILPTISYFLVNRYGLSGVRKDVWLTRTLVMILLLGNLAVAAAPTAALFIVSVCLYELSAGHIPAAISLIASTADEKNRGVVFGCAAVFEAIGGMLSGPILASLFNVGLQWGTTWYGLPFLFVGVLQIFSLVVLLTTV